MPSTPVDGDTPEESRVALVDSEVDMLYYQAVIFP
jgi:hypothetical protein